MLGALHCIEDDHLVLDASKISDREFFYYGFISVLHD